MTYSPRNAVTELLDSSGALKASLGRVPLDTLRLALSQLIDGLERLSEIGIWIGQANNWRGKPSSRQAWETTMHGHGGILNSTPLQDFTGGAADGIGNVGWGQDAVSVAQMNRADTEAAIRLCFDYAERYQRLAQALESQSRLFLGAQLLQMEGEKDHGPEPEVDPAPAPRKRKGPGGR